MKTKNTCSGKTCHEKRFKLQNGLTATLHNPRSRKSLQILGLCAALYPSIGLYGAELHPVVSVHLKEEIIWLVFYCHTPPELVIEQLQSNMVDFIDSVFMLVWKNRIYDTSIALLLTSIANKTTPAITALLENEDGEICVCP